MWLQIKIDKECGFGMTVTLQLKHKMLFMEVNQRKIHSGLLYYSSIKQRRTIMACI